MSPPEIRRIGLESPEYAQMVTLREKVLRLPLGLRLSEADRAHDAHGVLLVALQGGAVVATTIVTREAGFAQIRSVAVEPGLQRSGVGKLIMTEAERVARELGAPETQLDARRTAEPFYARLGYRPEGETFLKSTLPHVRMRKAL